MAVKHRDLPKGIPWDSKLGQYHMWFNMEWEGLSTKVKGKLRFSAIVTECAKAPVWKKKKAFIGMVQGMTMCRSRGGNLIRAGTFFTHA